MRHTNTKSASDLFVVATNTLPQSVLVLFLRLRNNHSKISNLPATSLRYSYHSAGILQLYEFRISGR